MAGSAGHFRLPDSLTPLPGVLNPDSLPWASLGLRRSPWCRRLITLRRFDLSLSTADATHPRRRLRIRKDDLDGTRGGFRFEFDDSVNDALVPALFDRDGRILHHLFQPADQIALVYGELPADANRL